MKRIEDPNLLVGTETADDAAVYRLNDTTALVQTLDFFTPIVDDPFTFGKIAAANSLSDVYAMGGRPVTAMNIVCFPKDMDIEVLGEILKGGQEKMIEAGCLLVGGHTVEDDEPKYGLSVTGLVHPEAIWTNAGSQPGDVLVLTKPIGAGVLNTALKGGMIRADDPNFERAVLMMAHLNKAAAEKLDGLTVHAVTDITGFGLLGHAAEMAQGAKAVITIDADAVPVLDGAEDFAAMGMVPAGAYANRDYADALVEAEESVRVVTMDLLYDPQTSGGLLVSLPQEDAETFIARMADEPFPAAVIGHVSEGCPRIVVTGGNA